MRGKIECYQCDRWFKPRDDEVGGGCYCLRCKGVYHGWWD